MPITCSKNYRKGSLYTLTAKSVVASGVLLGLPLRLHMLHARYTVVHSFFFDSVSFPSARCQCPIITTVIVRVPVLTNPYQL